MIRGLYTSGIGMRTQMQKMDVVSNNIANVTTSAFKSDETAIQSFSAALTHKLDDPKYKLIRHESPIGSMSLGSFVSSVHTDFSQGALQETAGSLDFAIEGDGFVSILVTDTNGNESEKLTRNASFTLTPNGLVVTKSGDVVLGEDGPITLPEGEITITGSGSIFVGDEFIDRLKLVDVSNKESLRKYGDNLYDTIDETEIIPFNGTIIQGFIEGSNVNSVKEMVKLIEISRTYEANQKILQINDQTLQKAVTELSKKNT